MEKNHAVASILGPIFFNRAEQVEVRLAALSLLFVSNPPAGFWNRVALSTWFEPNDQVSHYIYTTLASMAMNKNPMRRDKTTMAEAVLPLMKPMSWTSYSAAAYLKSGYSEKTRLGYVTKTANFPGFESFVPSHHYQAIFLSMGPWFTKLVDYNINSKHAEKFIDRLIGKPGLRGDKFRSESEITSPELNKIHDELKIEARATGTPELYVYVNFLDNYQRFFTFNPTTVSKVFENLIARKGFLKDNGRLDVNYHKYLPLLDTLTRVPSSMGLAYTLVGHHSILVSLKSDVKGGLSLASASAHVEGTLKPVVVFKMTSRLMIEAPWARAYPTTGVDLQIATALPGTFTVEADYKTAKIKTSWEFSGEKIRAAKYSVVPFTTIRKINDFTPALLLKDTHRVHYFEEPKETKTVYGERTVGMKWVVTQTGDLQFFKSPMAYNKDWFGTLAFAAMPTTLRHSEYNLYLDNSNSETKAIKTYFSFASKTTDKVDSPATHLHSKSLFETTFGEKIKNDKYVSESDKEWHTEKFHHVFQTLTNPTGYTFDFAAEFTGKSAEKTRRFGSSIVYGMDSEFKSHRASLMMEKERHTFEDQTEGDLVLCAELDAHFPETLVFRRKEQIPESTQRKTNVKIGFGKSCTTDRKVNIVSEWTRSEEHIPVTYRTKADEALCTKQEVYGRKLSKECKASVQLASLLNKNTMTIDYNEMPAMIRNATVKVSNFFRYFLASNVEHNEVNVKNVDHQIRIESVYYPMITPMNSAVDVRIYKPHSNTFYSGVGISPVVEVFMPKRMDVTRSVLAAPGVCLVGKKTVTTFDGLTYNATTAGCDHLITKDCSDRYHFAVLARDEETSKVVTILLNGEKIEVFPATKTVKVNGEQFTYSTPVAVKDAEHKVLAHIRYSADEFFVIESPSHLLRVVFDNKEVFVYASPIHRGRLCGLCGSQTGDKMTDLIDAKECSVPRDLMDVAYELKNPAGCKSTKPASDDEKLRRVQEECLKDKSSNVFGLSDRTPLLSKTHQTIFSTMTHRTTSNWTLFRNKMIVRENTRCFSTESVMKCKEGSRPVDMKERKLGFHCISKNAISEQLSQDLPVRPLDELLGKEVVETQLFKVPTACIPL
jgi:hypothetical protein